MAKPYPSVPVDIYTHEECLSWTLDRYVSWPSLVVTAIDVDSLEFRLAGRGYRQVPRCDLGRPCCPLTAVLYCSDRPMADGSQAVAAAFLVSAASQKQTEGDRLDLHVSVE